MEISTSSAEFRAVIDEVVKYIESHPKKKWIELDKVEEIYDIKPRQMFDLRKEKIIKDKKIGTKVLVSIASIEKFLNDDSNE